MEIIMPQTRSVHSPDGNIAFFAKNSFGRCFPQCSRCFDEVSEKINK